MSDLTPENPPQTDGDVRRLILETIMGIRDGSLDVSQGTAIAANFKELNNCIGNSINTAKLSLQMEERGRKFVDALHMGQQEIGSYQPKQKGEGNE